MSLQMTPEEIKRSYKQAADKRKQISILADLNLCDTGFIITILKENGIPADELPRRRTKAEIEADKARKWRMRKEKMTAQDNRQHEEKQAERQEPVAPAALPAENLPKVALTLPRPPKQETKAVIPEAVFEAVEREVGVCIATINALEKRSRELQQFLKDHQRETT